MTVKGDNAENDWIYQHARVWGYYVNRKQLDKITTGLHRNYEKYGEPYCPCRIVSGDKQKDAVFICPCEQHHKEIEENGHCKCNLYSKSEVHDDKVR
jgi:ferredoxin-thioredoxin reductase catalytic subunit